MDTVRMRRVAWGLIGLIACLAAGCVEVTETYHIEPDGSGSMAIDLAMDEQVLALAASAGDAHPAQDLRQSLRRRQAELQADPNVIAVESQDYAGEGVQHFVLSVRVRAMASVGDPLQGWGDERQEDEAARVDAATAGSDLVIARSGARWRFKRTVVFGRDEEPEDEDRQEGLAMFMGSMLRSALAGKYYTIRLHGEDIEPEGGRVDDENGSIEWTLPLVEMIDRREPWVVTASVAADTGTGWVVALAMFFAVVLVALGSAIVWRRRARARRGAVMEAIPEGGELGSGADG